MWLLTVPNYCLPPSLHREKGSGRTFLSKFFDSPKCTPEKPASPPKMSLREKVSLKTVTRQISKLPEHLRPKP